MNATAHPLKIGAVSYLNTLPLVYGLDSPEFSGIVEYDLPSRLADRLAARELDVALIPSIEVFQRPGYTVVSDACIACRGPVWSVKLMSRVELDEIQTMALDEGSRTSIALVQLLLDAQFDIRPAITRLPIDSDWTTVEADSVLIIGDRAMNAGSKAQFRHEIDLGQWWYDQTQLPFVFALWTARRELNPERLTLLDEWLSASRDQGIAAASSIAMKHAEKYGLTYQQCVDYFQRYLHFVLGPEERCGLDRFREMAVANGFTSGPLQLQFHDC